MTGSMRGPITFLNEADKGNLLSTLTGQIKNYELEKSALDTAKKELDSVRSTLKTGVSTLLKDKLSNTQKYLGSNESKSNDHLDNLDSDSQIYLKKFKTISGELNQRYDEISSQLNVLYSDKQMVQLSDVAKD